MCACGVCCVRVDLGSVVLSNVFSIYDALSR
jgi:hypothetical protein